MLYLFSVYDKAVRSFMQPFTARAKGEAVRMFTDSVNDTKSSLYAHPGDFELFGLGAFDTDNGRIESNCERIVSANDVLNKM